MPGDSDKAVAKRPFVKWIVIILACTAFIEVVLLPGIAYFLRDYSQEQFIECVAVTIFSLVGPPAAVIITFWTRQGMDSLNNKKILKWQGHLTFWFVLVACILLIIWHFDAWFLRSYQEPLFDEQGRKMHASTPWSILERIQVGNMIVGLALTFLLSFGLFSEEKQ